MSEQLRLNLGCRDRAILAASRLRKALHDAAIAYGTKQLADEWTTDADRPMTDASVRLRILEHDRHKLNIEQVLSIMMHDEPGSVLAVLCDVLGYETPQRRTALTLDEENERKTAAIESLGPEIAEFLRRKFGF